MRNLTKSKIYAFKFFLALACSKGLCASNAERGNPSQSECSLDDLSRIHGSGVLSCYVPLNVARIYARQSAASVQGNTLCVLEMKEQNLTTGLWCSNAGEWTIQDFQEIGSATFHKQQRLLSAILGVIGAIGTIASTWCLLFPCGSQPDPEPTIDCPSFQTYQCEKGERRVKIEQEYPDFTPNDAKVTIDKTFCDTCNIGIHTYEYTVVDKNSKSKSCEWTFEVKAIFCEKVANVRDGSSACSYGPSETPVYGDTCTFSCNDGFELDDTNDDNQECNINGQWSGGGNVECKPVSCGEILPPKYGSLIQCSRDYSYQSNCTFTCDDGFAFPELNPVKSVQCQSNRLWTGTPSDCRDIEPPKILNCPSNIFAYNDWRMASAEVTWTPPVASDNLDGNVSTNQTTGSQPGSVFISKQEHNIQYDAVDKAGNKAIPCTFTVHVAETSCPFPSHHRRLEWACEEHFTYGAHCNFSCEGNFEMKGPDFAFCDRDEMKPSNGFFNWGVNETHPYCLIYECADLDPPLNGALACGDWVNGRHCQMMCNRKYDIPRGTSVTGEYVCDLTNGRWLPHAIVPDCSVLRRPGQINLPNELFYFSGDCTDNDTLAEIRNQYISQLNNSRYSSLCRDDEECRTDNVQVTCGPISLSSNLSSTQSHNIIIDWDIVMSVLELDEDTPAEGYWDYYENKLYDMAAKMKEEIREGMFELDIPGLDIEVDENSFQSGWADILCAEGEEARETFTCAPCPTGTFYNRKKRDCEECPVGFYSDVAGAMYCLPCPEDTSTLNNRSKNITQCLEKCMPGTFSATGFSPCVSCPSRTYQSDLEGTKCNPCPASTSSPPESTSRSQCTSYQINIPPLHEVDLGHVHPPSSQRFVTKTWLHIDAAIGTTDKTTILEIFSDDFTISLHQYLHTVSVILKKPGSEKTMTADKLINDNNWHHLSVSWNSLDCRLTVSVDDDVFEDTDFSDFCGDMYSSDARLTIGHSSNAAQLHMSMMSVQDGASDVFVSSDVCAEDDHDALWSWDKLQVMPPDSGCTISYPSTCGDGDNCQPDPCNGHPCLDQIKDFICFCERNFTGKQCEIPPDYCSQALCQNEATCINNEEGYTCECGPDFRGEFCEEPIVHGGWSEWSEWSECSRLCGGGVQNKSRSCTQPPPDPDGRDCDGVNTEERECNVDECPECPPLERGFGHVIVCNVTVDENSYVEACDVNCRPDLIISGGETFKTQCGTFSNYTWTHQLVDPNVTLPHCSRPTAPASLGTTQTFDVMMACDEISNEVSPRRVVEETMRKLVEDSSCVQSGRCTQELETGDCIKSHMKQSALFSIAVTNIITADLVDVSEALLRDDIDNETAVNMVNIWWDAVSDLVNFSSTLNQSIFDDSLFFHIDGVDYFVNKSSLTNTGELKCSDGMNGDNGFCLFCDIGTFERLGDCVPCPIGTYQDSQGQSYCKSCPIGTTTEREGAINITFCSVDVPDEPLDGRKTNLAVAIAIPLAVVGAVIVCVSIFLCYHYCTRKRCHKKVEPLDAEQNAASAHPSTQTALVANFN